MSNDNVYWNTPWRDVYLCPRCRRAHQTDETCPYETIDDRDETIAYLMTARHCRLFHQWSGWNTVDVTAETFTGREYESVRQGRVCLRCGKTKIT